MKPPLRIAAADDEPDMRDFYQRMLTTMGHEVLCAVASGRELIERCAEFKPDLVITDIRMPDMDGLEAAQAIASELPVPVILVSAYHDKELIDRANADYVMAYLVKPIDESDLETAISIATNRFEQFLSLKKEATDLRQALADRKLIERAKGIIMKRAGVAESDAFRRLQKMSWDRNKKLAEIAQIIITTDEALSPARTH